MPARTKKFIRPPANFAPLRRRPAPEARSPSNAFSVHLSAAFFIALSVSSFYFRQNRSLSQTSCERLSLSLKSCSLSATSDVPVRLSAPRARRRIRMYSRQNAAAPQKNARPRCAADSPQRLFHVLLLARVAAPSLQTRIRGGSAPTPSNSARTNSACSAVFLRRKACRKRSDRSIGRGRRTLRPP